MWLIDVGSSVSDIVSTKIQDLRSPRHSALFSPDGSTLLVVQDGAPSTLWALKERGANDPIEFEPGLDWLNVMFSPDSTRLFLPRPNKFEVVEITTNCPQTCSWTPNGAPPKIDKSAFSPDGRWLAVSYGEKLYIWDLTAPKSSPLSLDGANSVQALNFSADASMLAYGSYNGEIGICFLRGLKSGDCVRLPRQVGAVQALFFFAGDGWLVTQTYAQVHVWPTSLDQVVNLAAKLLGDWTFTSGTGPSRTVDTQR